MGVMGMAGIGMTLTRKWEREVCLEGESVKKLCEAKVKEV